MSKLSSIEDIEQRNREEQEQAARAQDEQQAKTSAVEPTASRQPTSSSNIDMTAEEEEEFHGLDSKQPMGAGHKALIVLAVAVVIIAILYIVNSWTHFV